VATRRRVRLVGHARRLLREAPEGPEHDYAYPASSFVGYDLAEDAIARARSEAGAAGLVNARFEVRDAARPTVTEPFDVAFVFDAIHDQVDPVAVLERIHAALAPGGTFVMSSRGPPVTWRTTSATRSRRCCTRPAPCTA
jgi:SAM-dependent methyltransferase